MPYFLQSGFLYIFHNIVSPFDRIFKYLTEFFRLRRFGGKGVAAVRAFSPKIRRNSGRSQSQGEPYPFPERGLLRHGLL
jgi:hypothetical protein